MREESVYRIGLMVNDEECLESLYIEVHEYDQQVTSTISFSRKFETVFEGGRLLNISNLSDEFNEKYVYSRYFIFFDLHNLENVHNFTYSLFQTTPKGQRRIIKGPYTFSSNIHKYSYKLQEPESKGLLSKPSEVKVLAFGNHDDSGENLYKKLETENPDLIILTGNLAFDMQSNQGVNGDAYFKWMEKHFACTPVLVTPGSRENYMNTEFFNNRFMMPGTRKAADNNLFAVETQFFQTLFFNFDFQIMNQNFQDMMEILVTQTLKRFASRTGYHFNMFASHRPLHCKKDYAVCSQLATDFNYFERHLNSIKINLNLWGSSAHYERLKAIYNHQVATSENMFSIITGSGGNKENIPESVRGISHIFLQLVHLA